MPSDLVEHVFARPTHEPLDNLVDRDLPSHLSEHSSLDTDSETLAVNQDSIAIEDD